MPRLTLTSSDLAHLTTDAVVVAVASTPTGPVIVAPEILPAALRTELSTMLAASATVLGITGAVDEVRRVSSNGHLAAPVVVLTGMGAEAATWAPESLRRAAGAATRELAGVTGVALALPADDVARLSAVVEGALLGAYAYTRYRDEAAAAKVSAVTQIDVVTPLARDKAAKAVVMRAEVVAAAVHATRDLINTAPNDLYPAAFADLAKEAAKGTSVKVSVLDEKALASGGYGGLVGVGQGSVRGPRLVKVAYSPSRPAAKVALVGKGITFDSGGISIKPAAGMDAMKSDMSGAAAVLHTVVAAARLGLPVAVTGWLCLAENMPSGSAQRPSDVITIRGGTTVEVLNTDAEGRLVLADGLVAAIEEKPDLVLDIATLTGAQIVALGFRVSGVMGTDDARAEVVAAAEVAGEQFWPMPLPEELRAGLASKVADIANIGERWGGMLSAGVFLQEFVGSTPWAHLDIAGPSFNEKTAYGYTPVGGTGCGVRTMLSLIEARGAAR